MSLKRSLLNWILKNLYSAVTAEDVITVKDLPGGILVYLGGEQINDGEAQVMREEAKYLEQTKLWKVITQTLANEAQMRMFKNAKSWEDMYFGKAILHSISVIERIKDVAKTYREKT